MESKIQEIAEIITLLNLLPSDDYEKHNEYVKRGYKLLKEINFQSLSDIDQKICNSFFVAIDDIAHIEYRKFKTLESSDFIRKLISENSVMINGQRVVLTTFQKEIFEKMEDDSKRKMIFSMPTSFGKSMLIKMHAINNIKKFKRTIIITPTLSLMNEFNNDFKKRGIKVTSIPNKINSNVFVFTQERAIDFNFEKSDVLIIDEAYELARKDDRIGILYHSLYAALKLECRILMFMPNIEDPIKVIDNLSLTKGFETFRNFRSLSTRDHFIIENKRRAWLIANLQTVGKKAIFDIKKNFWHWEKLIIELFATKKYNAKYELVIQFLEKEFGSQFDYINYLRRGVVISSGDVPKIFRYFSELFYKNNIVNWIIANSTITKGVNLKPDHIAIFATDFYLNKKDENVDNFELRNALGRGGRYDLNCIDNRIGVVEFIATNKNILKKFKESEKTFTSDAVIFKPNKNEISEFVSTFSFLSKVNIDWINSKFNIESTKLSKYIIDNKEIFAWYINFKYSEKKGINLDAISDDKINETWKIMLELRELKDSFTKSLVSKFNFDDPNFILETLKYQGFRESVIHQRTFIESAKSEFNKLCDQNKNYKDRKIRVLRGKNIAYLNDKNLDDIVISHDLDDDKKNKILNALIMRKSKVWNNFVEAILNPLDTFIAKTLEINLNYLDELDNIIEEKNLPVELKRYLTSKINWDDKNIVLQVENICNNDKYIRAIKEII